MRPWASGSLLPLLLAAPIVQCAGIAPPYRMLDNHHDISATSSHDDNAPSFPLLTKLRDGIVEFLFGPHPDKVHRQPPANDAWLARYTNELVVRLTISSSDEEEALRKAVDRLYVDVWAFTNDYVDVRLHYRSVAPFFRMLPRSIWSSHRILIPNLADAVLRTRPAPDTPYPIGDPASTNHLQNSLRTALSSSSDNIFFQDYQPLSVIVRWMRLLEVMFPSYVEYTSVGTSYEGREIPALRVGVKSQADPTTPRKTIVVIGGLHAREWISTSTVNYLAWSFITSYGKEALITKLLSEYDIVFMPAVNPDGIEYTWQADRLWRKSRQSTNEHYCRGLDLDHAFGYEWHSSAGDDPCSESYGGEEPFQAVEAMRLATWARNQTQNSVQFVGLVDLHSYSQQILFPFTYSCAVEPPNIEKLEELGAGIAKTIRLSNGETYSVTPACEGAAAAQQSERHRQRPRVEPGGGSAIDWFYHEMGAHYSYQIKLRDTGMYGFLLPKEFILPVGKEIFDAMKYFGDYLLGNNGIERFLDIKDDDFADAGVVDNEEILRLAEELRKRR